MKTVIHFLCKSANPRVGGMEESIARISDFLARDANTIVRLYRMDEAEPLGDGPPAGKVERIGLSAKRRALAQPLRNTSCSVNRNAEENQLDYLVYAGAVKAGVEAYPDCRHAVLSFFISQTGFIAQHVADSLDLPHVVSARGSDLNRDLRDPVRLGALSYVVRRATRIVTLTREHEQMIKQSFARRAGVTTIPNSIPLPLDAPFWRSSPQPTVRLFSDCGYSYKKGTQVLLRVVADLASEGLPVRLRLTGNTDKDGMEYWKTERDAYSKASPGVFQFHEWIPSDQVSEAILASDLYSSATLGEGHSQARSKALALGIPLVTTRCGEMLALAGDVSHLHLAEPGDLEGFKTKLRNAIRLALTGTVEVNRRTVLRWRKQLQPEIEGRSWQKVFSQLPYSK